MHKSNTKPGFLGCIHFWLEGTVTHLSLASIVSVRWLWLYFCRKIGQFQKEWKSWRKDEKSIRINLIPATVWRYPMLLLVKPKWSWLKTSCWGIISPMATCPALRPDGGSNVHNFVPALHRSLPSDPEMGSTPEKKIFTLLILSLCWFGKSRFQILWYTDVICQEIRGFIWIYYHYP